MTNAEAIAVLIPLRDAAIRKRDDRANQFKSVHFAHMSSQMRAYYQDQRDEAIAHVEAFTLAIQALQNDSDAQQAKCTVEFPR